MTTGPALDPSAITAPANVLVVAAAPHSEVLPAAAAVVTRGGHGTVKRTAKPEAIAQAVRRLLDDPSFREAAARLGHSVRRDAASRALVAELEDLPAGRSPDRPALSVTP